MSKVIHRINSGWAIGNSTRTKNKIVN